MMGELSIRYVRTMLMRPSVDRCGVALVTMKQRLLLRHSRLPYLAVTAVFPASMSTHPPGALFRTT
jgi:hypothetical protein